MVTDTSPTRSFAVPGVSCSHCQAAISKAVCDVDLDAKRVSVSGSGLDSGLLRAAIEDAGYEVGS
jgi:copper chaperone CopZ